MSIYCNEQNDDFDDIFDAGCPDCDCQCQRYKNLITDTKKSDDKFAALRNSDLAKEITGRLSGLLNLPEEKTDAILNNLFASITSMTEKTLTECITKAIEVQTVKHFDNNIQQMIDGCFKKVVEEKIIFIQNNEKAFLDTIRGKIAEKFSSSFKDSRGRDYSNKLDEAVAACVSERVNDAIKELKQETMDKFSKQAMKLMMSGMAKAIGEDKKLLSLITA